MIKSLFNYVKNIFNDYKKTINLLIFTIFFNLFIYLKNITDSFVLSNIEFSFKNIMFFLVFVLSFLSIIFMFLLLWLVLLESIRKVIRVKNKFLINFFILFFNSISVLYIILDLRVLKLLGVHLHDKIAIKAFNIGGIKNDINLNIGTVLSELISPMIILILGLLIYFIFSFLIKKNKILKKVIESSYLIIYPILFSILFSFYLWSRMNNLANLIPVWSFLKTGTMVNKIESNYNNDIKNVKLTNKKNIIIVISESFRKDVFNKENMPNMFDFIKRNRNSIIIPKHNFSGAHFTLYSIFSLWYSVWSYHYRIFTSFTDYKDSAAIKLFDKLGYNKLFLTASHILEYDEAFKKVTKQFDYYKEFISDRKMIDFFKNNYNNKLSKDEKPFIVFLFIYASHFNYRYPKRFRKYLPVLEKSNKNLVDSTFNMDKKYKKELFNRYKNSVLYVDSIFNEILLTLNEKDKYNTVIVFTGDHGEGFWEYGTFGHASRSYKKEIVEVPLMVYLPGINKKIDINLSSHVDILPTILDYVSNITKEEIKSFFNGISLLQKIKDRSIIVSSLEPIGASDGKFCLVNNIGKLVFKTTKLTNNAKFFPLEFSGFNDKSIKNDSSIKILMEELEKFEKDYYKFFYFRKK